MVQASAAYEAGDYENALELYQNADRVFSSPNTRLGIAMCLEALGRIDEAVASYLLTETEAESLGAPRYEQALNIARGRLEELRGRVAWLTVNLDEFPENTEFSVNDRSYRAEAFGVELPVTPGRIEVRAEAEGFLPASSQLTLNAAEHRTVELELRAEARPATMPLAVVAEPSPPPSPPPRRSRGLAIGSGTSLGIATVSAALFAAFGTVTLRTYNELNDVCDETRCPNEYADQWSDGRSYQIVANVTLGIGIVAFTTGIALLVIALRKRNEVRSRARIGLGQGNMVLSW